MRDGKSDAEWICEFMDFDRIDGRWWVLEKHEEGFRTFFRASPTALDLDALREVEEKLIGIGGGPQIEEAYRRDYPPITFSWHLTAAQKIVALAREIRVARVIRGIK